MRARQSRDIGRPGNGAAGRGSNSKELPVMRDAGAGVGGDDRTTPDGVAAA